MVDRESAVYTPDRDAEQIRRRLRGPFVAWDRSRPGQVVAGEYVGLSARGQVLSVDISFYTPRRDSSRDLPAEDLEKSRKAEGTAARLLSKEIERH